MSTTVDSRVVEMRFDNQHFEKNVQTSLSTLEKLKQKLNLTGASKGLEDLDKAARGVNISGLGQAAVDVGRKLSTMEIIGITSLANITNSAVNAGKRMLKALTIDQPAAGWSKYEQKTSSVQTILNATGKSIDEVNQYLDKLMWFSDETSYGFTDMTAALSTMVSTGGDIDKLIPLITGVANATAFAGKGAAEFSRVLQYGINQAYSLGYMQVQDWKTIEGATVNSKQLIQTLIKAGEELGKIKKGEVTLENFRNSLKDKWLDTEVMESGFGAFSEFSDAVNRLVNGDLSGFSKEIKELYNAGEIETAADAIEALSKDYDELGVKAFKSAQEAKSFTEAIDATKDAVSSGWMKSFEIIFGDYEKAKKLWTDVANALWDVFASGAEKRNAALEKAFGGGSKDSWSKLSEKIKKAGINTEDFKDKLLQTAKKHGKVTKEMLKDEDAFNKCLEDGVFSKELVIETLKGYANETKKTGESTEDMTAKLKYFQKVVNEVWRGDYKNGKERIDALTKAGYNYAEVQALVNKTVDGHKLTLKDLSDAQLKSVGYTDKQIKAIRELAEEAEKSGSSVNELIESMSKQDGRTMLIESFTNVWEEFSKILEEIGSAWKEVFGEVDTGDMLYNVIDGIHKFTESLNISEDAAANFHSVVKGIFSLMDLSWSLASASFMGGLKIVNEILKLFGTDLLKVLGLIGDKISEFNEWVEGVAFVGSDTKWKDFAQVFVAIYEGVSKCVKSFSELKGVQAIIKSVTKWASKFAGVFSKGFEGIKIENIVKSINDLFNKIDKWIKGLDKSEMFNAGLDIVKGLASGISSGVGTVLDVIGGLATQLVEWFKSLLGIHSPSTVFLSFGKWIIAGLVAGLAIGLTDVDTSIKELATKFIDGGSEMVDGLITGIQNGFSTVRDKLKPIISKCAEVFGEIDFGSIVAVVAGFSMLSFFKKMAFGIDKIGDALLSFGKSFEAWKSIPGSINKLINNLSDGFTKMQAAFTTNIKTKSLKNLAVALAILAGTIIAIALVIRKFGGVGELWQAVFLLGALAGIMVGLSYAINMMAGAEVKLKGKGIEMKGLNTGLIGMGVTMLLLAATVKILGKMDINQAIQGFAGLAMLIMGVGAVFIAYAFAAKYGDEKAITKAGGMIFKISLSLLLMVAAVKIIGRMSEDEIHRGAGIILGFVGIVLALAKISNIGTAWCDNIGNMMLKLSASLLLMVVVMKMIAGMEWRELGKAGVEILGLVGVIALFALITNIPNKAVDNLGGTMLKISGALVFLAVAVKILGGMEWNEMGKAAVGLMGLVGVIAILVYITQLAGKDAPKIALTLLAMSVSIGILAIVAAMLGIIKLENLAKGIIAVGMLGGIMALIVHVSKGATDIKGTMIGMAVAIGVMAASLAILSFIKWQKLLPATAALAAVMLSFAAMTKATKGIDKSAIATLIIMTVMVALLAIIIKQLSALPVESTLANSLALSTLLMAMVASIKVLSGTSGLDPKILISVGVLSLVIGALAGILYLIQGMPVASTLANATALSVLLIALSAAVKILSTVQTVSPMALAAVGVMTLVMGALAGILYLIQDMPVASTLANAKALSNMLIALSAACVILGVVGLMGPAAFIGIGALATLIAGIGTLIVAIGALVNKFPQLETFLDKGIPLIEKIGSAIGSFFGNIVGGFMEGVTNGLPGIGENLSAFMDSISGFVDGARDIDESALTGMTNLVKMLAMLSGAKILDGLSSIFGSSSGKLALELAAFGYAVTQFSDIVSGNIDESAVEAAANAGMMLAKLQTSIAGSGGIFQIFAGEKNLSEFGTQLVAFGDAIVKFSNKVKDNVDEAAVTAAANAGTLMATLQSKVEPTGGVVQWFTGEKDMATFGGQLVAFGAAIVMFSDTVKGNVDETAVTAAANAGTLMAEMQAKIVPSGGVVGWFTGEKDMAKFGEQLVAFGSAIVEFSNAVSAGIDETAVAAAATAGSIMTELQDKIEPTGGVFEFFTGTNSLDTFGDQLVAFGDAIVAFSSTVAGNVDEEAITAAANAGKVMVTLQKSIPEDKWLDGKVSLSDFGATISSFGGYINAYSQKVAGIDSGAIDKSLSATKTIIGITKGLNDVNPDNIDNFNAEKLGEALKDYADNVADIDQAAVTNSVSATRKIISLINSLANLDTSGVSSFKSAVSSLAQTNINGLAKSFSSSAKQLSSVGGDLAANIAKGMSSKSGALNGAAKSIVGGLESQLASASGNFSKTGSAIMLKFATGIMAATSEVTSAIKTPIAKGVSTARLYYSNFYNAGEYLVKGFASGISANTWRAEAKAKEMAKAAERAAKKALDEHSPSRVFYKIGDYAGLGFVNALSDHASTAYSASTVMADSARQGLSDAMSKVNDILSGDMDVQPTIRPVLDLSDVRSGAGAINGLLGNGVTVGAMANVNAIGSMMNQNGKGDDVVSAINRLRKDLGNLGNTTYNVNGVTYDDGSNVSNAVKDIIRYTRIEGRV